MAEVRVLIADDDTAIAELMLRRLAKMGLRADRAQDGQRALELLERAPYDLILTDIYMPGATGLDILRRVKQKDPHVQVVIVTGSATLDNAVEALNMGAFSYLSKPFEHVSVFDNAVSRALEFRRLIRDNQRLAEIQRRRGDLLEAEVTERIKQMRRKQQDLVDLLARLPQVVLVLDAEGRTALSNPLAEEWLARDARDPRHPLRTLLSCVTASEEPVSDVLDCAGTTLRVTCHALPPVDGKERMLVLLEETVREKGRVIPELAPVVARLRPAVDWLVKQARQGKEAEVLSMVASQLSGLEELAGLSGLTPALPAPAREAQPEPGKPIRIEQAELDAALAHIADVALGTTSGQAVREEPVDEALARAREKVLKPPVVPEKPEAAPEPVASAAAAAPATEAAPPKPDKPVRKGLTSRLSMFRQSAAAKRASAPLEPAREAEPAPSPSGMAPLKEDELRELEALFQAAVSKSSEGKPEEEKPPAPAEPRGRWPPPLPSQSNGQ